MAINHFAFAQLFFSLSLCYAAAQIVVQSPVQTKWENVEGYELKPRSMTQLASLPEIFLIKRGKQEPFHSFGQKAILLTKRSEEQQPESTLEKKPRYLGHKRDLSETELIILDYKDMPKEEVLLLKRIPGHSLNDLRWKQRDKEKLLKAGKHYAWMDMVPDRDGSFDPTVYHGSGVPHLIHDMKSKLQKQGIHKDWMDKSAAQAVHKRDIEIEQGNTFVKRNQNSEEASVLNRRAYTVSDASKCNIPSEKTGPSGNKVVLTTGCQYHGLGFGTSKHKREIQQPITDQLQKRFVILPPIETDEGIRFNIARDDGIIFLKRSPEPKPNVGLVSVAASSFANSFTQARNNRKKTVVLSSDSDGNITGARAVNSGGSRKLINVNFVSRPRHQYQHQVY